MNPYSVGNIQPMTTAAIFSFLALERSEIAGQAHTAVVLLTKHCMSTVIISALETQRVCRAVCSSVQSSEAALISLGDSRSTETQRLSKAPWKLGLSKPITFHVRILPHRRNINTFFFKRSRAMKGFMVLHQWSCLTVTAASCKYVTSCGSSDMWSRTTGSRKQQNMRLFCKKVTCCFFNNGQWIYLFDLN